MQNVDQTIVSQYKNAPSLTALIQNFNGYLDPTANIDAYYELCFDIPTAVGYGLDRIGRIVGVQRVLQVANATFFGFSEALPGSQPFNQAPFFTGSGSLTSNYALLDPDFRTLIYAKCLANICDGSVPAINRILLLLFPGRGNCYCTDNLDMTMTYTFTFTLSLVENAILTQTGVLPKPTGVAASFVFL
jgi:hypothetical protein